MSDDRRTHVAVDVRMARAAGHGTYLRNIIPRLVSMDTSWQWSLLGDVVWLRGESWAQAPNVRLVPCNAPVYSVREQLEVPLRVPSDADLLWAPNYNTPVATRHRLVVTIHDAAHLRLPEYTSRVARRTYARLMFRAAVSRASAVICNSEFTRREVLELVGKPSGTVTVVHMGVDDAWFAPADDREPLPVQPPYFVFVGSLKPHKNVSTLLAAFRRIEAQVQESLVIVGGDAGLRTADAPVRAALRTAKRVRHIADAANHTVRAIVRRATALVLPSLYEGFGFPPVEAMAAGVPAIVSRAGSLPEVCGDAALYVDALDADALAAALVRVTTDAALRQRLIESGRTRARKFGWDKSAERTMGVLRGALGAR